MSSGRNWLRIMSSVGLWRYWIFRFCYQSVSYRSTCTQRMEYILSSKVHQLNIIFTTDLSKATETHHRWEKGRLWKVYKISECLYRHRQLYRQTDLSSSSVYLTWTSGLVISSFTIANLAHGNFNLKNGFLNPIVQVQCYKPECQRFDSPLGNWI
jgi:hypothetical protein